MVLTGSLRFQVALSRFIDDVSTLAIEDCLINKLSTLFRSSNVLEMSHEDLSRLAGETPESSLERKRLETKRGILETGLQGLKSLHKRRKFVDPLKQDQVALGDSEQMSANESIRSEKASVTANSAEVPPRAITRNETSHSPERAAMPSPFDEWPPQAVFDGNIEDKWAFHVPQKNNKKVFLR